MAQPPAYTPVHSFLADSATLANFPGQALDVEFNDVKATTDGIRTNLKLIQRDDGAIANGGITYDQLSASLQAAGLAPANAWATGTAYSVGANVVQSSALYRALVPHTASVFAADLAAAKWTLITALQAGATGPSGAALTSAVVTGASTTYTAAQSGANVQRSNSGAGGRPPASFFWAR
jgi:hypothetical protein